MQKHAKDKKNKMQINICQQMPGMLNQQLFTANCEAQKTASELMGRWDLTQLCNCSYGTVHRKDWVVIINEK